jgi:molybdate transport system substrate-binding protein
LQDLANPGVKLVLAVRAVPVGGYTLDFLSKASAQPEFGATYSQTVLSNVVSYEEDVRAVFGPADAGCGKDFLQAQPARAGFPKRGVGLWPMP